MKYHKRLCKEGLATRDYHSTGPSGYKFRIPQIPQVMPSGNALGGFMKLHVCMISLPHKMACMRTSQMTAPYEYRNFI